MRTEVTPALHRAGGPARGSRVQDQLLPLSLPIGRNGSDLEGQFSFRNPRTAEECGYSPAPTGVDVSTDGDAVAAAVTTGGSPPDFLTGPTRRLRTTSSRRVRCRTPA
jgi:hypothetical protein